MFGGSNMETQNVYNELKEMLCNQDKALKELVWTIARNKKLSKPKNVLLVGEVGSGKTTMVKLVADKLGLPLAEMSGFCTPYGTIPITLYNACTKLYVENKGQSYKGIVLIHDMKDVFLCGGLDTLNSVITSGVFTYENHFLNISETMFIGEVDNNGLEDCFIEKPVYTLDNIDEAIYSSSDNGDEVKDLINQLITNPSEDLEENSVYNWMFREALMKTFLSLECSRVFNKKIFMDRINFKNIKNALKSPISELQTYDDDLCEEYMNSEEFINSVAEHIEESLVGLHDLDDAVRDVSSFDSKRKRKVYKDRSLMRF